MNTNLIDTSAINAIHQELREIRGLFIRQQSGPTQKSVLTLQEAATLTGLSKSHIYKLTSTGGIPCYKRGKHLFFKREELECWMLSNRKATREEIDALATNYVVMNNGGVK